MAIKPKPGYNRIRKSLGVLAELPRAENKPRDLIRVMPARESDLSAGFSATQP
jgi:hypothetical protein